MPYPHFGNIGDIWKHLPLCEIIACEKIDCYVETNSAFAEYDLFGTVTQKYGVFHFYEQSGQNSVLNNSKYYQILKSINPENKIKKYLGSPGLAIEILQQNTNRFIFYDIEQEPLESIGIYSKIKNIGKKIELYNSDSLASMFSLSGSLDKDSFIFIDPYLITNVDNFGRNYLDLFKHLSEKGYKCFLWYGFTTHEEKNILNTIIREAVQIDEAHGSTCIEIIIKSIQKDFIKINPGILGCGILTANLSNSSNTKINHLCDELVKIYKGCTFESFDGELYKDSINN
jgi:23S rRNA (adenine2030-N6)-methyltransferase